MFVVEQVTQGTRKLGDVLDPPPLRVTKYGGRPRETIVLTRTSTPF